MFGNYSLMIAPSATVRSRPPRIFRHADTLDVEVCEALEALAAEFGSDPDAPSGDDLDALLRAIGE
jgi:hypothetical protein